MEVRSVGTIQSHPDQRLIHGQGAKAVTPDAAKIPQGLFQGLAQADAKILNRVVCVNLRVSGGADGKIKKAMHGKEGEHVIHKWHTRGALGLACAVKAKREGD